MYAVSFCSNLFFQPGLSSTTSKLVAMLRYYLDFEVDEFTGQALSFQGCKKKAAFIFGFYICYATVDVCKAHSSRIARLQEAAFVLCNSNSSPGAHLNFYFWLWFTFSLAGLREFALAHVGSVSSRAALKHILARLDALALQSLAVAAGISGAFIAFFLYLFLPFSIPQKAWQMPRCWRRLCCCSVRYAWFIMSLQCLTSFFSGSYFATWFCQQRPPLSNWYTLLYLLLSFVLYIFFVCRGNAVGRKSDSWR